MKLFYITFLGFLLIITCTTCKKNSLEDIENENNQFAIDDTHLALPKDLKWLSDLIEQNRSIDPSKALFHCTELIQIAQKLKDKNGEGLGYYQMGYVYEQDLQMYVNSLTNYFISLYINKEINNIKGLSSCYLRIGGVYYKVGLYEDALKYYQQFLLNAQKLGNKEDEATAYRSIALTNRRLGKDAFTIISFYDKALQIRIGLSDEIGIADCYNGIANTYLLIDNYKEAKEYYLKALAIQIKNENIVLSENYFNLAIVYKKLEEYATSFDYHLKSLALDEKLNNQMGIKDNRVQLGSLYLKQKEYVKAIDQYSKAEILAESLHDDASIVEICSRLYTCYTAIGDKNKALIYSEKGNDVQVDYQQQQIKAIKDQFQQQSEIRKIDFSSLGKKQSDHSMLWLIGMLIGLVSGAGVTLLGVKRKVKIVETPMIKLRDPKLVDLSWWHTNQLKWIEEEAIESKKLIQGIEAVIKESLDRPTKEVVQVILAQLKERLKTIRYWSTATNDVDPTPPPKPPTDSV